MNFHTDLALERQEYHKKQTIDGVIFTKRQKKSVNITDVEVINEKGEAALNKPKGKYITLESPYLYHKTSMSEEFAEVLALEIAALIPKDGTVLVAGLGNNDITPDALGPKCASMVFASRHLTKELQQNIGLENLRSVCTLTPGVLGKTGIEAAEIIEGTVKKTTPSCIIAVDALAARNISRLGTTVQLSSSGIEPGSGVGNHRKAISGSSFGIPVIAVGVPTVVDGATMAIDILEKIGITDITNEIEKKLSGQNKLFVTPKSIDNLIESCAHILALAINKALQPALSLDEIKELTS